jgi:serine O-acetyltransferase
MASKMGFDAYGATQDAPDPVAHAINCMLDHLHVVESKMKMMCEAMREMGVEPPEGADLPDLPSCEIVSTADELRKMHLDDPDDGPRDQGSDEATKASGQTPKNPEQDGLGNS